MGYKNKICTVARTIYNIYIHDSQLNRPESVSLANNIYIYPRFSIEQTWECLARFARSPIITRKMVPIMGRASS